MKILMNADEMGDSLEEFRPDSEQIKWELVISGIWEEDMYHSGHVEYYLASLGNGHWVLDCLERNGCLDSVTEEDVEEGTLNDDQIQAMWGMTLEEAQNQEYRHIVAVCSGVVNDCESKAMATLLYQKVSEQSGKVVSERYDTTGLLE